MTRRRVYILAGIVLAILIGAYVLRPRPPEVELITIARADATQALAVNGRIRPRRSVEIRSIVAGDLIELPYDVGDRIGAGTIVARIDDGPQREAVAQAEAAVRAQEAVVPQARRDLARLEALGQFAARVQIEEARLDVEREARELQRLHGVRREAQELRARFAVAAPFAGIIMERPVDRGQAIGPETVLYRFADLAAPEISAEVDEVYAARLRPGTAALVELAGQDGTLRAQVVHIEPRVDEATGAREVRLRFEQAIDSVAAGQTVSVNLIVERRPAAISVPRSAILDPDSRPRVRLVDEEGQVSERAITFEDWPAAEVIVTRGLAPGMRILADPNAASPGTRVRLGR